MTSRGDGDFVSRGRLVFVVTTVTFALATVFVAARVTSRFLILKHRTWDDWVMILAWLIAFGLSFAIDFGAYRGLGRHDVNIPSDWLSALRQSEYAFTILYNPALMATKTSILIFYLRLAQNTQKFLRRASYATLALVNLDGIVLTLLNAFQCSPIAGAYTPQMNARCMSVVTLYLCSAPVNIVANLAILVLPIPLLTGMRLPSRQKTVLVLTFSLGIFVTIIDVVRIYYLQKASDDQVGLLDGVRLGTGTDFSWNSSISLMWSAVEVNVGIICACIPTLKPLIKRILPSAITGMNKSTTERMGSNSTEISTGRRSSATPLHIEPPRAAHVAQDKEHDIDMMDFLTTPETNQAQLQSDVTRNIQLMQTNATEATQNTVYFGLIDMKRPKSMLKTKGMESFKYCTAVTILFFLWGFSYGLLNTLNNQISIVAHETVPQRLGLSSAYFVGYLIGPLTVGQYVIRHLSFKATFIYGLCIYGVGTLMFWPSAVMKSWPGFLICQFVVGFGLAVLETAANPFVALCGPPQFAEYRLLLSQGLQASASILSQLLAQKILFDGLQESPDGLLDVQWTYLAVTLATVVLALFFYYMPLPEATDNDLQRLSENLSITPSQMVFGSVPLIYTTALLAVLAQFMYVSAQECNSTWFGSLLRSLSPEETFTITISDYTLVAQTLFASSRFIFAPLCLIIRPRILLFFCFLFGTIAAVLAFRLEISANEMSAPILVLFFFEGPVFPLVFAIGLRGMGRWTKWTASFLVASVSGGAAFPFVMWGVRHAHDSVQYSYSVMVGLFALATLFPIYLTMFSVTRHQVDPAAASALGNQPVNVDEENIDFQQPEGSREKRRSLIGSMIKRKMRFSTEVEHRERQRASIASASTMAK